MLIKPVQNQFLKHSWRIFIPKYKMEWNATVLRHTENLWRGEEGAKKSFIFWKQKTSTPLVSSLDHSQGYGTQAVTEPY